MTKYFSSLFACCGRWPTKEAYSEFNVSCSSYEELAEHGFAMPGPTEWIKYGENDYDKLHKKDKALFDEEFVLGDLDTSGDELLYAIFGNEEVYDARK